MPNYPFRPKSTASLRPGDFWAVPLGGGHFGCGRVIQLKPLGGTGSRVLLLAGLINWLGTSCPTADSIANHRTIAQGQIHLRSILETGGEILGYRSLDDDGIEPDRFLSESPGENCMLQSGYEILRRANPDEQRTLNVLSTWGYLVIKREAARMQLPFEIDGDEARAGIDGLVAGHRIGSKRDAGMTLDIQFGSQQNAAMKRVFLHPRSTPQGIPTPSAPMHA